MNSELANPLAELSKTSVDPVVAFYEFDEAAWGFSIYAKGRRVGRFWNRPGVVGENPKNRPVKPDTIARFFGVPVDAVAPYVQQLDPEADDIGKAFPDDKCSLEESLGAVRFYETARAAVSDPRRAGNAAHIHRGTSVD